MLKKKRKTPLEKVFLKVAKKMLKDEERRREKAYLEFRKFERMLKDWC